jgi:hypothetical protein
MPVNENIERNEHYIKTSITKLDIGSSANSRT